MVRLGAAAVVLEEQVQRHRSLLVSWAAPVGALHLVSGADQRFSTWNHAFSSRIAALENQRTSVQAPRRSVLYADRPIRSIAAVTSSALPAAIRPSGSTSTSSTPTRASIPAAPAAEITSQVFSP
jgi:hypothetical protein